MFVEFYDAQVRLVVNDETVVDEFMRVAEPTVGLSRVLEHDLLPENRFQLYVDGAELLNAPVSVTPATQTIYLSNRRNQTITIILSDSRTIALD